MSTVNNLSKRVSLTRDQVLNEVKQVVAQCQGIEPEKLQENTDLDADLHFDSLERVELAMEIEEQFDVTISDEMEQQIRTVGDIVDGVMKLLNHQQQ